MIDYANDFVSFSKSANDDTNEYEIAVYLEHIASQNGERIYTAKQFVELIQEANCAEDRKLVRIHLDSQLDYYQSLIEIDISSLNGYMTVTKRPAVSQTGINLKADLRNLKDKFKSLHQ